MQNLTKNEILIVKYGLALVLDEIGNKARAVKNPFSHMPLLTDYKKQMQKIMKLIEKIDT